MGRSKGTDKYYGVAAALALLECRIEDVQRVFLLKELLPQFERFLKKLAHRKVPYRFVGDDDLQKLTQSTHHEGVCIVAKSRGVIPFKEAQLEKAKCVAYLDGVSNPHNLGAILRTAAHFGISHILTPDATSLPPSGYRIARGGAEYVTIVSLENPVKDLLALKKKGFALYTTSPHKGVSLQKTIPKKKSVLILGGETEGVSPKIEKMADERITILGTSHVESLNVSNAFCLLAYHFTKEEKW